MAGIYFKNSQYNQMINSKYKKKYRRLKRIIKNYVFENAALCDQIAQIQENMSVIKEERRYLLKKLIEHEKDPEAQLLTTEGATANSTEQTNPVPAKRGPKKRLNSDTSTKSKPSGTKAASKKQQVMQTFTVDQQGRPVFPIYIGNLTIHSIGEISPENKNFHTENWIYPIGYTATRIYSHPKEPERKCTFTCKILDNSGAPQFQIIPDADFDHVFFGESADICHLNLLETIVRCSDIKNLPNNPQGEVFFGLGHPTVMSLLQSSPNFKKCANFKGFQFNASFGIEEKDPTLCFEALQKLIAISVYHTVPEIKEEPPDELLE